MKKIFTVAFLFITAISFAQDATALRTKNFNTDDGVAVSGYDVVAYFKQNDAVKGKKQISLPYQGVTYYFSTVANREEFRKNPAMYEPQYGGWCAYAMGKDGSKVEIDPETFKIINGKLYLYYNRFFNNTLKSWNKDETNLKNKADANWTKIYH